MSDYTESVRGLAKVGYFGPAEGRSQVLSLVDHAERMEETVKALLVALEDTLDRLSNHYDDPKRFKRISADAEATMRKARKNLTPKGSSTKEGA